MIRSFSTSWKWKCASFSANTSSPATTSRPSKPLPSRRRKVIAKPGSVTPHKKFMAEIYVLSLYEGGRHTPIFTDSSPPFYFPTTDVTRTVQLLDEVKMMMPGGNVSIEMELITPIAMEKT